MLEISGLQIIVMPCKTCSTFLQINQALLLALLIANQTQLILRNEPVSALLAEHMPARAHNHKRKRVRKCDFAAGAYAAAAHRLLQFLITAVAFIIFGKVDGEETLQLEFLLSFRTEGVC